MNIKKSIVLRARLAFLFVFLFAVAVVVRVVSIQTVQGEKWRKIARENLMQFRKVKATRGNIFSDNGSLLATSLPFYKLAFDPQVVDKDVYKAGVDSLSMLLANHFKDRTWQEYKRKLNDAKRQNKQYLVLNRNLINYNTKKQMSAWPIFREGRLGGGVIFEKVDKRFKPFSGLAHRTIGFLNEDKGGAGLEISFNKYLAGHDGEALFRKIAGGSWKPMNDNSEISPKEGLDITTTLDVNIQDVAESSLEKHLRRHDADYGCVVLMEVSTGEIKAMVNLSKRKDGTYQESYNYAVGNQGLIEPGSTFKLASMMAVFEESGILPTDTLDTGSGEFEFYDRIMTDSRLGGYGKITVAEAFEKSSNIGVSRLVNEQFGIAPDKFLSYLESFGLARPLGFQMAGEAIPYIKTTKDKSWSGISLPWMSIGYELKLSPLHILAFYNGVANGGKMISPVIVKEIRRADKVKERYTANVIKERLCSDRTLGYIKNMLVGVVERGTARNISDADYQIAGKTGTAQKIVDGRYTKSYYASFAGYFPADKPKYSCIVVIDNPKGYSRYGSDAAAPVFKEIADKVFATDLELHKPVQIALSKDQEGVFPVIKAGLLDDLRLVCNALGISNHAENNGGEEWVVASIKQNSINWKDRKIQTGIVPNVGGMRLRDALYILENSGLRVKFDGIGRVETQSVSPGQRVNKGETIYLTLN
jgi:cell division protein FtsI (penicillin-binding protein 3)